VLGPLALVVGVVLSDVASLSSVAEGVTTGTTGVDASITDWDWVGASERATSELSTGGAELSELGCLVDKDSVGSWADEGVCEGAVSQDGSLPYVAQSEEEAGGDEGETGETEPLVPK
jgi:hypothetical protein